MKKFLTDHPVITMLIAWALFDTVGGMYRNHCQLELAKGGKK